MVRPPLQAAAAAAEATLAGDKAELKEALAEVLEVLEGAQAEVGGEV